MTMPWWGWVSVLIVGLSGAPSPTPEEECWQAYLDFRPRYDATRGDGVDARAGLRGELADLVTAYEVSAPVCAGRALESLAYLLVYDRHFTEAEEIIEDFLTGPGRATSDRSHFKLRQQRGYALGELGEIRESAQDYFLAGSYANRVNGADGVDALIFAAEAARELDDFDTAQRYLDSAFGLIRDSLAATPQRAEYEGLALSYQTFLLSDQIDAQTEEGHEYGALNRRVGDVSRRALEVLPTTTGRLVGYRSLMTNEYALSAGRQGDHAEAERRLAPTLAMAQDAGLQMPEAVWAAWTTRSRIAEMRGDLDEASEAAHQARLEARRKGLDDLEAGSIERLGHLAERAGDLEEAETHYRTAIEWSESQRSRLGLQDWTAQLSRSLQTAHRGLARVQHALGDSEAAFLTIDQTRARYLRDLRDHLDVRRSLGPGEQRRADSLQTAIERERLVLLRDGLTPAERARVIMRVSALQEELSGVTQESTPANTELTIDRLQRALLRRGQTLISYFVDAEVSLAFVVRPDTFVAVRLEASAQDISARLQGLGDPWRTDDRAPDPAFRLDTLHRLYLDLVDPVARWVDDGTSLVVVPDGPIAGIPFGMLTSRPATDYATAPYLVRGHAISTELAASMVAETSGTGPRPAPRYDLLAFGRSEFDRSTWNGAHLPDLPHVRDELRQVRRGIRSTRSALNEEATEADLDAFIGDARVIHLASHAETDPALPLYSKIALWGGDGDDGTLYLYELQGRALPADLVVLSGCSTARGRHRAGEGMIGLQYAVRSAGSKASLATLWPVDDDAMVDLMAAFYDGLREGLTKDRALQRAQLRYLDEHRGLDASPFFWAAPVLSGDPSPVPFQPSRSWVGWGSAFLLGGLVLVWLARRRFHA